MAANKRKATVPVVRDALPAGATVAFDGTICAAFARLFRHELHEKGYGPAPVTWGGRRGRKNVD